MNCIEPASEAPSYLRNPSTLVVLADTGILYLRDSDPILRRLDCGAKCDLASRILVAVRVPMTMECLASETGEDLPTLRGIVECLVQQKLIISGSPKDFDRILRPASDNVFKHICNKLIVGVCGSIYAAQVLPQILFLKRFVAANVEVVLTDGAHKFLKPEVFGFYGIPAWTDPYETRGEIRVPHIHLAQGCDLLLVLPASASFLHRAATGDCSDLLSLLITAVRVPIVMVPVMNPLMASNIAIRGNIERLKQAGVYIVEPGLGFEASSGNSHMTFSGVALKDSVLMQFVAGLLKVRNRGTPNHTVENETLH